MKFVIRFHPKKKFDKIIHIIHIYFDLCQFISQLSVNLLTISIHFTILKTNLVNDRFRLKVTSIFIPITFIL